MKTEREKMLAGEIYDANYDEELLKERMKAKEVCFEYNNLKPYEYFEYLLEEIPKHMDDMDRSFLDRLLPWSPELPEHIRKTK